MTNALKNTAAPENLSDNLEKRRNDLEKEEADIKKRIEKVKNKEKKAVKRVKKKYDILFGRTFGWIFLVSGFLVSLLFLGGGNIVVNCVIGLILASIVLAYMSIRSAYSNAHIKKEMGEELKKFTMEKKELQQKAALVKEKRKELR